jgi:hypothetical protein
MNGKNLGLKSQISKEIDIFPFSPFFFFLFPFFFFLSFLLSNHASLSLSRYVLSASSFSSQERLDFSQGSRVSFLDIDAPSKSQFLLPTWLNVGRAEVTSFHKEISSFCFKIFPFVLMLQPCK